MRLPDHKAALFLTHNSHLNYYETVVQAIERMEYGYNDWVSEEQKRKAIETDDCWFIQWYPNTPIGSYTLAAADLEVLLDAACKVK